MSGKRNKEKRKIGAPNILETIQTLEDYSDEALRGVIDDIMRGNTVETSFAAKKTEGDKIYYRGFYVESMSYDNGRNFKAFARSKDCPVTFESPITSMRESIQHLIKVIDIYVRGTANA